MKYYVIYETYEGVKKGFKRSFSSYNFKQLIERKADGSSGELETMQEKFDILCDVVETIMLQLPEEKVKSIINDLKTYEDESIELTKPDFK